MAFNNPSKTKLVLRLPNAVHRTLKKMAKADGRSMANLAEHVLVSYIKKVSK